MIFLVIALGVVVGAVMGLVGAGGGIISVPVLVGLVGVPVADAMTASLVMAITSASTAVVPRLRGGVDWPVAAAVSAAGIPAALVGTAVNALLPQSLLLIGFGALMLVAGVRMLRPIPDNASQGERQPRWLIHAILIGLGVGMLTGLLGVGGGGFVIVPALALLLHLPMKLAIGTSLVVTVANSLAGAAAHASIGGIDVPLTVAFTIPAMIASLLGARLAAKLPGKGLQIGVAVLVLVIAVVTLVATIIPLT